MEKFLSDINHEVKWANHERLYTTVAQLSKKTNSLLCNSSAKPDWKASYDKRVVEGEEVVIARRNLTGRPDDLQVKCKLCKGIFAKSDFKQHFERSHGKKEPKYQQLPGITETTAEGKKQKVYSCSACSEGSRMSRKQLKNHLLDEKAHTASVLLDHGIHAWQFRNQEHRSEIEAWLLEKDLIDVEQKVEQARKRDEKQAQKPVL